MNDIVASHNPDIVLTTRSQSRPPTGMTDDTMVVSDSEELPENQAFQHLAGKFRLMKWLSFSPALVDRRDFPINLCIQLSTSSVHHSDQRRTKELYSIAQTLP